MADSKMQKGNKKGTNKKVMKNSYATKKNVNKVAKQEVAKAKKVEAVVTNEIKEENVKDNRTTIIALVIGLVVGALVMLFFGPKVATLKDGEQVIVKIGKESITADELYKDMKNYYSVSLLLDKIDNVVLTKLYPEDDDMKNEVNEMVDYYIEMYNSYYGYTEEQFLSANGFDSKDDFKDALRLDYRRTKYFNEYVKRLVTDAEIENYYNESVFGDIEAKYITVEGTDDNAKALATKVINRFKNGETYDAIVEHYGDRIASKDLEYVAFDSDVDAYIVNALLGLEDNSYTTEAIKTSDSYIVVVRGNSKEKASLEDVKDKIVDILASEKKNNDTTLTYKALIDMRKENSVNFEDTDFAKKYDEYVKQTTEEN